MATAGHSEYKFSICELFSNHMNPWDMIIGSWITLISREHYHLFVSWFDLSICCHLYQVKSEVSVTVWWSLLESASWSLVTMAAQTRKYCTCISKVSCHLILMVDQEVHFYISSAYISYKIFHLMTWPILRFR